MAWQRGRRTWWHMIDVFFCAQVEMRTTIRAHAATTVEVLYRWLAVPRCA